MALRRKVLEEYQVSTLNSEPFELPLYRTQSNHGISCSTCDDGGCPDCTEPS